MRIIFRSKHFTLRRNLLKPSAKNIWKTAGKITGLCLLFPGYLIWAAWCFGAICYAPLPGVIRYVCAGVLVILILSAPLMRPRLYFTAGACLVMLVISGLWCLILPSNDRSWAPESARLPEIRWHEDGKSFTVRNIRDFRYRTTRDFDVAYLDRTYSLDDMTGLEYAHRPASKRPFHHGQQRIRILFCFAKRGFAGHPENDWQRRIQWLYGVANG